MRLCNVSVNARLLLRRFLALVFLAPALAFGQAPQGRSKPVGPADSGPKNKTEIVNGRRAATREVLFQFRDTFLAPANERQISATLTELRNEADADEFEMLSSFGTLRLRSRSKNVDDLVKRLSKRPEVLFAEPNYVVSLSATTTPPVNDQRFGDLWGLHNTGQGVIPGIPGADIDAVRAWTMTTGSTQNVVAVIDTGIDYNHPDLAANMWRAPTAFSVTIAGRTITCAAGTVGYNALTDTCDPMDDQNHGTHVAGTIGAVGNNSIGVVGINRTARIMGLKFLDADGFGDIAGAIKAIDFAIQVKARFAATRGANVRVLNNSWGGDGFSQALLDAIQRANTADMLFVAAAGNDWRDIDFWPTYPASYNAPNVLTVAATDSSDLKAWFSNYGPQSVQIAAPGENILSTVRRGEYAFFSGTSMATPHVAGAAALVLSNCTVNTFGLKDVLLRTAERLGSLNGVTRAGARLNVANAVANCSMPYYTISANPAELSVMPGGSATYTVTLTPFKNFSGAVTMSVTGLPPGVTATFQPAIVSMAGAVRTTSLTLTAPVTTLPGIHPFTINGVGSTQDRTASAALRVQGYTVTDLGTLPAPAGSVEVEARGVNSTGQIVGFSNTATPGSYAAFNHAFLHTSGTIRDLGTLGGPISMANGIGNAGHVVGYSLNAAGFARAFLWLNGRMQDLGTLPGFSESWAEAVNNSGYIAGYASNGIQTERAFLKTTGAMVNLGTLGGGWSRATAINNLNHVVGYSAKELYTEHAFLYSNGVMRDLGTIGANPQGQSRAFAINDTGQIVGASTVGADLFTYHATLWSNGTVRDLGALLNFPYSFGKGINGAGHVVGYVAPTDDTISGDTKRAFLYKGGRMLNLNETLPANTPWTLLVANSINDSGVIVGVGKLNNEFRAFRLTPLR